MRIPELVCLSLCRRKKPVTREIKKISGNKGAMSLTKAWRVECNGAGGVTIMMGFKVWVEPLFGEAKEWHGMRRFRLRRLWRVNCEALVIAAGQNLKRLLKKRGWGRRLFPSEARCASFWLYWDQVFIPFLEESLLTCRLVEFPTGEKALSSSGLTFCNTWRSGSPKTWSGFTPLYWLLGTSVQKTGLGLLDHSFPLPWNSREGQGEAVPLPGWREEVSIRQDKQVPAYSMHSRKRESRARGLLSKAS